MIWGLGLPKTGTTSLSKAVWVLHPKDLRMGHSDPRIDEQVQANLIQGDVTQAIPPGFCGACEVPEVRRNYQHIDAQDPDAKFILTVRTLDSWLDSMEAHRERNSERRLWPIFQKDRTELAKHFTRYHVELFDYFRDTGGLVTLNIVDDPGHVNWAKLEAFLGWTRLERESLFPHKNPTPK